MLVLLLLSLELFKQVLNINATQQMSSLYSLEMLILLGYQTHQMSYSTNKTLII